MGPTGPEPRGWHDYMAGRDNASCPTLDFCPYNTYRISGDINNSSGALPDPCHKLPHPCHTAGSWVRNLNNTRPYLDEARPLSRPGCWQTPDNLQVGRVEVPPLNGYHPCSSKPVPCSGHKGRFFCPNAATPGQCGHSPSPCPPCPPPAPPGPSLLDRDTVFFSWNRAHFGAWVITVSALCSLFSARRLWCKPSFI